MLPLNLLKAAVNSVMLIELKNGESYNGRLISVDSYMNIHMKDVICTSSDGTQFWKMPEIHIRGNCIVCIRISDDVLEEFISTKPQQTSFNKLRTKPRNTPKSGFGGIGKEGLSLKKE
ncbi:hypothetical protein SNEBB_000368 [Seison nebaliae]|nr:hypothetical protein SNEBB_000368 [Seison nebaliae]